MHTGVSVHWCACVRAVGEGGRGGCNDVTMSERGRQRRKRETVCTDFVCVCVYARACNFSF